MDDVGLREHVLHSTALPGPNTQDRPMIGLPSLKPVIECQQTVKFDFEMTRPSSALRDSLRTYPSSRHLAYGFAAMVQNMSVYLFPRRSISEGGQRVGGRGRVADVGVMSEHAKARVAPSYACAKDEPRHSLSGERAGSEQGSSERASE